LTFYLFGKVAELYRQGFFSSEVILSVLQELKDNSANEIKAWAVREYEYKKSKLGEAVRVFISFRHYPELRDWYATLPIELRRGVWIATHYRLLDKFQNLLYNITQNQ
jgi:hypothetical protein